MQDAFLVALERGITDRTDAIAIAWLRTTVRNLFLGDLRARARKPARVAIDLAKLDSKWNEHGDRYAEHLEALEHCLPDLDPRDRVAAEQRYRLNWSRERMAESLGLTPDGVKSLMQRIRDRLRKEVGRRLEEQEQ